MEQAQKTRNPEIKNEEEKAAELAADFHKFYNAQRVLDDNESLRNARLFLCGCVRDTMKIILNMMKIDAPEQM